MELHLRRSVPSCEIALLSEQKPQSVSAAESMVRTRGSYGLLLLQPFHIFRSFFALYDTDFMGPVEGAKAK